MSFDIKKKGLNSYNLRISNFFEIVKNPNPAVRSRYIWSEVVEGTPMFQNYVRSLRGWKVDSRVGTNSNFMRLIVE
jgi:hypothetical protein